MSEHPRPRELEALAAGEASPIAARHLENCGHCRDHVASLAGERAALLARAPTRDFVAAVAARRRRDDARRRRRTLAIAGSAGGVALAAAGWMLVVSPSASSAPSRTQDQSLDSILGSGVRLKGVGVEVLRKRGGAVAPLAAGDRVRAGDGLRLSITIAATDLVSVWFVDDHGRRDRFPGGDGVVLEAGTHVLPGAVAIDAPCIDMTLVVATSAGEQSRRLVCE